LLVFFFNDTATTEIYTKIHTLSLLDALPFCAYTLVVLHVMCCAYALVVLHVMCYAYTLVLFHVMCCAYTFYMDTLIVKSNYKRSDHMWHVKSCRWLDAHVYLNYINSLQNADTKDAWYAMYIRCWLYTFCIIFGDHILYILFSSCQLAPFGYPDWGFSVLFPQL
jgi:hypothetical protein